MKSRGISAFIVLASLISIPALAVDTIWGYGDPFNFWGDVGYFAGSGNNSNYNVGFIPTNSTQVDYDHSEGSFGFNSAIIGVKDVVGSWNSSTTYEGTTLTSVTGNQNGDQYWGASISGPQGAGGVVSVSNSSGSYFSTYTAGPNGQQCQCNFQSNGDYYNGGSDNSCYGDC